jgi:hypothetical protein
MEAVKVGKRPAYMAPTVDVCRVELEGVIAVTTHDIGFTLGENDINNWQETVRGEAISAGQGGDVYIGAW